MSSQMPVTMTPVSPTSPVSPPAIGKKNAHLNPATPRLLLQKSHNSAAARIPLIALHARTDWSQNTFAKDTQSTNSAQSQKSPPCVQK